MSTNDDENAEAPAEVTTQDDEQLRQDLKQAVANDKKLETETPPDAPNADEPAPVEELKPDTPLTTDPEHDLDWYKKAYAESTKEALRLKAEQDKKVETPAPEVPAPTDDGTLTPEQLYIRQKQNEEITEAFSEITDKYPTLKDKDVYDKFVAEANLVGKVIVESEKRYPSPKELYEKTAVILGLQPDTSEATASAMKNNAASPRTSSAPASPTPPSKVTEEMIEKNLKWYPLKTRQEIIAELEPHIN